MPKEKLALGLSRIFCGEDKKNEVDMSFEFPGELKKITPWDNSH